MSRNFPDSYFRVVEGLGAHTFFSLIASFNKVSVGDGSFG